ncbi:hypothetical protein KUTeg_021783 [Tegillarca granosa]|uniref:Uncharacterized protein n=1 Tax=Tegillarca granosa TaxID=220873 RepID=A0ABQ9E4L1_TEGGR|nr:hypothetical protein KUTeg_021783 [Tegillarca granosa]
MTSLHLFMNYYPSYMRSIFTAYSSEARCPRASCHDSRGNLPARLRNRFSVSGTSISQKTLVQANFCELITLGQNCGRFCLRSVRVVITVIAVL